MSQQDTPPSSRGRGRRDRPVLWGLVALVGVGLVIGLLAVLGATALVRTLGLDGGVSTSAQGEDEASMYLPKPGSTSSTAKQDSSTKGKKNGSGSGKKKGGGSGKKQAITLSAGQSKVGSMGRIDLVGKYRRGEGAVLQVQRKEGGSWSDFPVSVTVSDGRFSTYVQTGRSGPNRFRVRDTDSKRVSNPVTVRVGG